MSPQPTANFWQLNYEVLKINGQPYYKEPDMIRAFEEAIPGLLQKAAEHLADRFDFPFVKVTAKSLDDPTKQYTFRHADDDDTLNRQYRVR
jgi:hypothetical protein